MKFSFLLTTITLLPQWTSCQCVLDPSEEDIVSSRLEGTWIPNQELDTLLYPYDVYEYYELKWVFSKSIISIRSLSFLFQRFSKNASVLDTLCNEWEGIGRVLMAGEWTLVEEDKTDGILFFKRWRSSSTILSLTYWILVTPFLYTEYDGIPSLLTDLDGFYVKIVGAEDPLDDILLLWGGPYGDICFTYKRKLQPAQMRRSLSFTCVVMSTRHLHYDFKCYNWILCRWWKMKERSKSFKGVLAFLFYCIARPYQLVTGGDPPCY